VAIFLSSFVGFIAGRQPDLNLKNLCVLIYRFFYMIVHQMKLAKEPFDKIASGEKIIESRLFDEKRQLINVGDEIEFSQNDDPEKKVKTTVMALYRYDSFENLFSDFPSEYFGGDSKEFLLEEISRFYPKEEQEKYGVVGIKIEIQK
jgi:ASC-1-like (ASCH) protein